MKKTEVLKPDGHHDVQVLGELDANLSDEYFGSFNFIFENKSDKWLTLNSFDVSFRNDSANKYINVVKGDQLVTWSKVVAKQNRLESNGFDKIEESIFNFGSDFTGISRILGPATDVLGINKRPDAKTTSVYPENHVYAEEIVIPPGMLVEKWILFNSSHHKNISYLNEIYVDFVTDTTEYEAKLRFRKPKKRGRFSWSSDDPNTWRLQLEPYLIMNSTDISQTLAFSDLSVSSRFNFPLENPELGLRAEIYNQEMAFIFDIFSINASDDVPIPEELLEDASGRFDFDIFSSELLAAYKLSPLNVSLDLLAGVRYRKIRFDPEVISEIGALEGDWVNLVFGSRLRYDILPKLFFNARSDIGGVGGSANYTWNNTFGIGYTVTKKTDLTFKLNITRVKFEEEKNTRNAFVYDGSEVRLLLGAAIKF